MAKKKISDNTEEQITPESAGPPVARQTHTIVTKYQKEIPVDQIEPSQEIETIESEDPEQVEYIEYPAPRIETSDDAPPAYQDAIGEMLRDLQVERRQFSWVMVVERLPKFEKDGRHDVGATRINCGTRPMSPDFIEEIRAQFARPNKSNHFRVTIKRNGKIYAHWPEVISLEPPPPEVIAEIDRTTVQPSAAAVAASITPPGFSETIEHIKALAKLRNVLFPEVANASASPVLSEEAALLKLVTANPGTLDQLSEKLGKRLFGESSEPSDSWLPIVKSAIDNGPSIIAQIFAGIQSLRSPEIAAAPAGSQFAPPPSVSTAPPPATPPAPAPPPEMVLLNSVIQYLQANAPAAAAAAYVDGFGAQNPTVEPMIDSFLSMSPDECLQFMNQFFPAAGPILTRPGAAEWIAGLQAALKQEEGEGE